MRVFVVILMLALAACSRPVAKTDVGAVDKVLRGADVAEPTVDDSAGTLSAAIAKPQIAYDFTQAFSFPGTQIASAMARHQHLCEALGATRCRLVRSERSDDGGKLVLSVAAGDARALLGRVGADVAGANGQSSSLTIDASDVSPEIVDVAARIQAKELLVARLRDLLARRGASVADLVAAEKALADAQGELDSGRSALTLLQHRIAQSSITFDYHRDSASTAGATLGTAFRESGALLIGSLAMLVRFVIVALPWVLVFAALAVAWRRGRGQRNWRWRRATPLPPEAPAP